MRPGANPGFCDRVLTPAEAALLLRVSESVVRRMARDGSLA